MKTKESLKIILKELHQQKLSSIEDQHYNSLCPSAIDINMRLLQLITYMKIITFCIIKIVCLNSKMSHYTIIIILWFLQMELCVI